jgi:hypothetical protein
VVKVVSELNCEQQVVEWHLVKIKTPIHVVICRVEGSVPSRKLRGKLFAAALPPEADVADKQNY